MGDVSDAVVNDDVNEGLVQLPLSHAVALLLFGLVFSFVVWVAIVALAHGHPGAGTMVVVAIVVVWMGRRVGSWLLGSTPVVTGALLVFSGAEVLIFMSRNIVTGYKSALLAPAVLVVVLFTPLPTRFVWSCLLALLGVSE